MYGETWNTNSPSASWLALQESIDSKHNIIRSVFLRLKEAAGADFDPKLAAYKVVSISNDLYGNDILSVFDLAKGFSIPISVKPIDTVVPDDVLNVRDLLHARRKLALIHLMLSVVVQAKKTIVECLLLSF